MRITLIRHLPTNWNRCGRLQGRKDIAVSDLSANELAQVEKNQELLMTLAPFDIVLASTLQRTQQTAEHYGFKPNIEPLLDELDFGPFEGRKKEDLSTAFGNIWVENPVSLCLGESIVDFGERVKSFLNKYRDYGNVLIFGHGCWIRALISYHQFGHFNNLNKRILKNNECVTVTFENLGKAKSLGRKI